LLLGPGFLRLSQFLRRFEFALSLRFTLQGIMLFLIKGSDQKGLLRGIQSFFVG
jgi:hypothetical protein